MIKWLPRAQRHQCRHQSRPEVKGGGIFLQPFSFLVWAKRTTASGDVTGSRKRLSAWQLVLRGFPTPPRSNIGEWQLLGYLTLSRSVSREEASWFLLDFEGGAWRWQWEGSICLTGSMFSCAAYSHAPFHSCFPIEGWGWGSSHIAVLRVAALDSQVRRGTGSA